MQELKQHVVYHIANFHKHYVGSAHSFEILNQDPIRPDVAILKTFFIDDTVNANDWQATWEGLKEDAEDLLGTPLVLQEDLEHPKYSVQKMFDRGTIFDYDIDEANHRIIVYVRITDPTIIERIKSGELEYVSPAVIPRGSEHMKTIAGVDVLDRTLPLHLAIVGDPAYGKDKAKMTDLCTGDPKECYHRLKITKTADSGIPALEQIPFIKKMVASASRIASVFEQMKTGNKYPKYNGMEGHWIKAKGMDVFIARNQSIKEALLEQCGCAKLGSTEGKISKEKANYQFTTKPFKNCNSCRFFNQKEESCQVVEGTIHYNHVSDLWQPKT